MIDMIGRSRWLTATVVLLAFWVVLALIAAVMYGAALALIFLAGVFGGDVVFGAVTILTISVSVFWIAAGAWKDEYD